MKHQALLSSKDKSKQEMLQYVTNVPKGPSHLEAGHQYNNNLDTRKSNLNHAWGRLFINLLQ